MPNPLRLSIAAGILALALAACGSSSSGSSSSSSTSGSANSVEVETASNPTYGTILVTGQGATLYHLSGETASKFICTSSACLATWHPLTVPSARKTGREVDGLGTIRRPDGSVQIAYHGTPLYTFAADHPGETKGEGLKDVGTWTVVTVTSPRSATGTSTTSTTPASPSGGGYGY